MKIKKEKIIKIIFALIGIAILYFLPNIFRTSGYTYGIYLACIAEIYYIALSGVDILTGYCGQVNMGVAGFYAIGCYGSGLLHNYLGINPVISIIIASICSGIIGAILAYPCSKLKFHFLTLSTIAFGEIVNQIISHSPGGITGNFNGMFTDKITIFGMLLNTNTKFYYFGLVCVAFFVFIKRRILFSKVGRALQAIRDNVKAADGMGINVKQYKVIAFAACAFFVAFAGGMYMHLVGFASPDSFTQKQSVMFLTMLVFGGITSFAGPAIGVVTIMTVNELLRKFNGYQTLIYGIIIIIVVMIMPGGLYRYIKDAFIKIKNKLIRKEIQ